MKRTPIFILPSVLLFIFPALFSASVFAQGNCMETAKIVAPELSTAARADYEAKKEAARLDFEKNPQNPDAHVWLGRRIAYLGDYRKAIRIFTAGHGKFPADARFLRHRGHRFLTLRCFDDAAKDFELAAKLVKGKPDEIEPDGLPNARGVPTSSLQTNIFYHLGLAYYLKKDYKRAHAAFMKCFRLSRNDDMRTAAAHWIYMSARRQGKAKAAARFIEKAVAGDADIIENDDYFRLMRLYQGKIKPDELLKELGGESKSLSSASLGYGLGNWFFYNGEREKAVEIFRRITSGNQWASFGYIAAETENR